MGENHVHEWWWDVARVWFERVVLVCAVIESEEG